MDQRLKFKHHVDASVAKAHRISAVMRRAFIHMEPKTFCLLFKALVRPHLEYAQAVWQPHQRGQIDAIEKVQRRATKQVPALKNMSYPERLRRLNLPTLAFRRLRGDMIEMYKLTHGIYDNQTHRSMVDLSTTRRTRGHSLKLRKPTCNRDVGKYSFRHRVVNDWNALTEEVVTAPSMHSFENRLDKLWTHHPLKHNPDHIYNNANHDA